MKPILLKAVNYNWCEIGPGSWDHKIWRIYGDSSYKHVIKYRPEGFNAGMESDAYNGILNEITFKELKALSKEPWPDLFIDAYDGEAWELTAYDDQGNVLQTFKCGYIYGIDVLEKLVDLLPEN